jgi:hypothetical protein
MKEFFRKYSVLIVSLSFLYILYFSIFAVTYYRNEGHYIYSLDDAYIHMAIAKNVALHGVWGVTKYEFSSSSSSILWTGMLAVVYLLFGVRDYVPFLLNLIFASLIILSAFFILNRFRIKPFYSLYILLAIVFLTPLPPLMFTGLEHVMHIWVSLLFIYFVSAELSGEEKSNRNILWLLVVSLMLPSIRYEGIFLAVIASILFLIQKRFLNSILVFICAFLPIYVFGVISINNGWSFFPNSLLLKGSFPDITSLPEFISFTWYLIKILLPVKYLIILFVGLFIFASIYYKYSNYLKKYYRTKIFFMLLMFVFNLILYAAYSKSGWSYRYQSFLVSLGIFVFGIVLFQYIVPDMHRKRLLKWGFIILFIFVPLVYFAIVAFELIVKTPIATTNIYEQQYQMGQFLRKFYENKGVALNDIGTSNYFADIRCVDLWGLSNLEVSKKRRSGFFDANDIRSVCKRNDVKISIAYDTQSRDGDLNSLPAEWIKAGEWEIRDNIIAGNEVISFYAVNSEEFIGLRNNLIEYSNELPRTVKCRIFN